MFVFSAEIFPSRASLSTICLEELLKPCRESQREKSKHTSFFKADFSITKLQSFTETHPLLPQLVASRRTDTTRLPAIATNFIYTRKKKFHPRKSPTCISNWSTDLRLNLTGTCLFSPAAARCSYKLSSSFSSTRKQNFYVTKTGDFWTTPFREEIFRKLCFTVCVYTGKTGFFSGLVSFCLTFLSETLSPQPRDEWQTEPKQR